MKVRSTIASLILICTTAGIARAESIPGNELLSYFGAGCQSKGQWVTTALGDAEALMKSLNSVLVDPACVTVGGAIASIGNLQSQMSTLAQMNSTQISIASLNAQEQELMSEIAKTTDAAQIAALEGALSTVATTRVGLAAGENATNDLTQSNSAHKLQQLINTSNTVFSQVTANQQCLRSHPQLLQAALSLTASVGATVATVNPALGIGLAAASDFIGSFTDAIRKETIAIKMRKIAQGSTIFEAYKCALETMSMRWCQMDDAEKFLKFNADNIREPLDHSGLAGAIRLNDREVPTLIDWLETLRAGNEPSDVLDAMRKISVYKDDANVKAADMYGKGVIAGAKLQYDNEADFDGKWGVIQYTVNQLIPNQGNSFDILLRIMNPNLAPYYLLGLDSQPKGKDGNAINWNYFDPKSQWPNGTYTPDYDIIGQRYALWIAAIRKQVDDEIAKYLQPDPLRILITAFDKTSGKKLSAYDSIATLIAFLSENVPSQVQKEKIFGGLYVDTVTRLQNIKNDLDDAISGKLDEKQLQEKLLDISVQSKLDNGTILLQMRLDMIVRLSLYEYISKSSTKDQNLAAQLLAAERFKDVLSQINGTTDLVLLNRSITEAKGITMNNLSAFSEVFHRGLRNTLKYLQGAESDALSVTKHHQADINAADTFRQMRTQLCYGLISTPVWESSIARERCTGLQMNEVIKGGPKSELITDELISKPFEQRACLYRDFLRNSKIYQDWGISPPAK